MATERPIAVLLVEDDHRLALLVRTYLEGHGVVVTTAADGRLGLESAQGGGFDVVLLDLMLPGLDGLELCRRLRERSAVPVIMLTARGEEADRVLGLENGADDYVQKPFSPRELLARIRAQVRRARGRLGQHIATLVVGDLVLDPASYHATVAGQRLELTSYEFNLLRALAERRGRVLSREQLMEFAGGNVEEAFDRSIDVHISHLRQKLGDDPRRPRRIRTVRGVGYQLLASDED